MPNFKLTIEYDGTHYHGWQRQSCSRAEHGRSHAEHGNGRHGNGRTRTIQGEIENALSTMTRQKIVLTGSGRTDAGVHALGQVANFRCETNLTAEIFQKGLNSMLDEDIIIRECQQADENFHARFDVKSKLYHYRILNRFIPVAIGRQYAWFIRKKLNIKAMREASSHLIGTHDFKAFEGAGSPRKHTVRSVFHAGLTEQSDGYLVFEIEADGFLRFMVRNIVGTIADVGLGKITPDKFREILLSKDRNQAGMTAPPHGLFLVWVKY